MNRCPTCGASLEDGQDFCPATDTMQDGVRGNSHATSAAYVFLGCAHLDMRRLSSVTVNRSGSRSGKTVKQLTDYQRAEKAWGKDCIMSEYGPLPMEREIREGPSPYDIEWGQNPESAGLTGGKYENRVDKFRRRSIY